MKTLKVLITGLIVTTGSGCAISKGDLILPLCLPERPVLQDITKEEQEKILGISPVIIEKISKNDIKLKIHIKTIEQLTEEHNAQFKVKCVGDTE